MLITTDSGKKIDVQIGTEVFVPCRNRGGHGAWVIVTKLNKKTFKGIERERSYKPGVEWTVHFGACFAIVEYPEGKGWVKHWVNDF